jgi:hypothetical protein
VDELVEWSGVECKSGIEEGGEGLEMEQICGAVWMRRMEKLDEIGEEREKKKDGGKRSSVEQCGAV